MKPKLQMWADQNQNAWNTTVTGSTGRWRIRVAVGTASPQFKNWGFEVQFCVCIQVYAYMVHIVNIRILYMGFLANRSHPYVLVLTDSTGILCRRNPLCFRVFHPVMQQILHLLRFIHQISISSLLFWSIWNSFRQCGRETVPRHPKGCQMDS